MKIKISTAGKLIKGSSSKAAKGFTLIELTIVLVLLGIMMSLTMPRVSHFILTDNLKTTTRHLMGIIKNLRNEAYREYKEYTLHFDLEANQLWIDSEGMNLKDMENARKKTISIPEDVRVLDIWTPEKGKITTGQPVIHFFKRGYIQHSVIHLDSDDGRQYTLELSPFLSKIMLHETYIEFEDLW